MDAKELNRLIHLHRQHVPNTLTAPPLLTPNPARGPAHRAQKLACWALYNIIQKQARKRFLKGYMSTCPLYLSVQGMYCPAHQAATHPTSSQGQGLVLSLYYSGGGLTGCAHTPVSRGGGALISLPYTRILTGLTAAPLSV